MEEEKEERRKKGDDDPDAIGKYDEGKGQEKVGGRGGGSKGREKINSWCRPWVGETWASAIQSPVRASISVLPHHRLQIP